jgi:Tol biopolymer transport system component
MRPLVAALTVVVLLVAPGVALTAFPGDNGRIAFDSDRAGNVDIWTMDPDGSDPLNLTADSAGADFGAAWSPDGGRIAFARDTDALGPDADGPDDLEIWVMRADGSRQKQITDNAEVDLEPAWSPDGRHIVFQRDADGPGPEGGEIWVMRADGSREKRLTNNAVEDNEPTWSPDGRRIAFHRDTSPVPDPDAGNFDVFDMRPDGSDVRRLTDAPGFDGGPNYSPDGRKIAFDSERDGDADIWVMRRNGDDPRQLTGEDPAESADDILTAWSPDGRFMSFSSNRDSTPEAETSEIYVMRSNGTNETNVTNDPAFDVNPDWQPLDDDDDDNREDDDD